MLTPWVSRILFLNVAIFLAEFLGERFSPALDELIRAMVLVPAFIPQRPWTLVTYMFLHAGIGHIFFNMLSLFIFGPRVEAHLGGRRFVALYFISGIAGGLLSWPFSPFASIVGASGAILGVMYGFARYWPRERIMVWFAILEARFAVLLFVALDLFAGFGGGGGNIAHFAHLGGAAGAFAYLQLTDRFSRLKKFEAKLRTPRPSRGDLTRWSRIQRETLHEVNREEFDRIMKKIEDQGIGSVTPQERNFLDTFSDRAGPSQ
jgi:membrane associated rhomboid family serine protease